MQTRWFASDQQPSKKTTTVKCRRHERQLKRCEQALPPHQLGVNQRGEIGVQALANLPGLPGVIRSLNRHVDDDGSAYNIILRNKSPIAAVVGIVPVVSQNEEIMRGNRHQGEIVGRIGGGVTVRLGERGAVYEDYAALDLNSVSRHTDETLDVVFVGTRKRRAKNDHLL